MAHLQRFQQRKTIMKRKTIVLILIACVSAVATKSVIAQTVAAKNCSSIEVSGLKANTGTLEIAAYTAEDGFMKRPSWGQSIKVTDAAMRIEFCDAASEEVSFMAYQDLNGNRKLDMNPIGIPTEPYSASGKPSMFGPPTWKDTKVSLADKSAAIAIKF
jgi:uncharacterized protein (DUF2141 family)